ncbi:MAG: O-antigen ligase family protein, partial [Bacteroidota bacterium]
PFIAIVSVIVLIFRGKKLRFGKEDLLLLAFVAYALLSSFYATKGRYEDVRGIYLAYIVPFFLYTIVKNLDINARLIRAIAFAFIFHVVVLIIMGLYEYQTGLSFYTKVLRFADVGRGRIAAPFGSPISLGVFVPLIFLFIFQAYKLQLLPRFVVWISGAVCAVLIILTFTRSVWLGAFLTFVYILYRTSDDGAAKVMRLAGFVAAAVVLALTLTLASPDIQQRLTGEENVKFRVVMAQASVNMFFEKPIIGWGAGTFDDFSDRYLFDALGVYIVKDTSHVTLLTLLAELGVLGTLPLLLFIYYNLSLKHLRMSDLSPEDRLIVAVNVGGIISFAINAFLIDFRFYSISYSWFFINLGFIQNVYRQNLVLDNETV